MFVLFVCLSCLFVLFVSRKTNTCGKETNISIANQVAKAQDQAIEEAELD
jgi:hypothetical protein